MKKKVDAAAENGTVDCSVSGGTGKISERDGTGEKVCGSQIYRRDGRILGAGIFRATGTRRWRY